MTELALTIKNPWAFGIILGTKDVENRSWRPDPNSLPLRVWIHAGKAYDGDVEGLPSQEQCSSRAGTICGIATVTDVHHATHCDCSCSVWAQPDQWHWRLGRVHAVDPVPVRGMLGLWPVPADVLSQLHGEASA